MSAAVGVVLLVLPLALHWELVWSGRILSAVDTSQAYFPLRWLVYSTVRSGSAPWWNQYVIGGMPLAAQPDAQAWYLPGWLLFFVLPPAAAFNVTYMLHYGLAGLFTFLLLRRMELGAPAAACGALSFMWCGFLAGHRVHSAMVETAVWMPAVLWTVAGWWQTRHRVWLLACAACAAVQIFAGYMQIVLMTWGAAGMALLVLSGMLRHGRGAVGAAVVALAVGALAASVHVLGVMELARLCTRAEISYAQFSSGAFSLHDLWMAFFPFFKGAQWHASMYTGVPYYRGVENYAEMACYAGAAVTLAAACAWCNRRARVWVVCAASIAAVALVLMAGPQTPLWRGLYHVPLLNKFRVPARYLLLLQIAVAMLGAAGLDVMLDARQERWRRVTALALLGVGICALGWLVHTGCVPGVQLQMAWVRVPLLCAAAVWLCTALCMLPGRWGRVTVWLPALVIGYEMTRYGFNALSSDVALLLDHAQCPPAARVYHAAAGGAVPPPRVFNCFRDYLAKDRGIGANRNILMHVPTLDAYGPLYLKPFAWLGHDPSGFYTSVDALLRGNRVLSMLQAAYVADFDAGAAVSQPVVRRAIEGSVPVPLPPLDEWQGTGVRAGDGLAVILAGNPAVIYTPVVLRSNSAYRMTIDTAATRPDQPVRMDLYADGYDHDAQEFSVRPLMLERRLQRYQHVIETGDNAPSQALLRVFTFSQRDVNVAHVALEELQGALVTNMPGDHYEALQDGVWRNLSACPRAWCVEKITPVAGVWAALDAVAASPIVFDPHREALVEGITTGEAPAVARIITNAASANARLWEVENTAGRDAFLVISEVFYPGWRATLNGRAVRYYRVNGLIGGVSIPPGRHTIVIAFRPTRLWMGVALAVLGAAGLAATCARWRRGSAVSLR